MLALAVEQGGSLLEFFGPVELPSEPFVVYAVGSTHQGEPYQRALGKTLRLQPVRVLAPPSPTLSPGAPASLSFRVQNSGALNTFFAVVEGVVAPRTRGDRPVP